MQGEVSIIAPVTKSGRFARLAIPRLRWQPEFTPPSDNETLNPASVVARLPAEKQPIADSIRKSRADLDSRRSLGGSRPLSLVLQRVETACIPEINPT